MDKMDVTDPIVRALLEAIERERAAIEAERPVLDALRTAYHEARDKQDVRLDSVARRWNAVAIMNGYPGALIDRSSLDQPYVLDWIEGALGRLRGEKAAVPA